MNLHAVTPTVRGICYILSPNHGVTLSEGAVSNCLWMTMANNQTYRKTESGLDWMRTPWDGESAPSHTAPVRHMRTIPSGWMDEIPAPDRPPLPGRGPFHQKHI